MRGGGRARIRAIARENQRRSCRTRPGCGCSATGPAAASRHRAGRGAVTTA
ncbi:hypothetical protein A33M_0114 [Rhodovulum sp. PH10]|nr:hypothetical protein A33M_0114 [Rhodovulum sp. PH10]